MADKFNLGRDMINTLITPKVGEPAYSAAKCVKLLKVIVNSYKLDDLVKTCSALLCFCIFSLHACSVSDSQANVYMLLVLIIVVYIRILALHMYGNTQTDLYLSSVNKYVHKHIFWS